MGVIVFGSWGAWGLQFAGVAMYGSQCGGVKVCGSSSAWELH